jgi:hypothetical protein
MSLKLRRLIFYSFCLAFLVITPIVFLYASGYQIDRRHLFTPLAVQKTGMAIVYSEPSGAEISLNGQKQKTLADIIFKKKILGKDVEIRTPARIKNLIPGFYDLRVELPGYWPWERRIEVFPGKITHVLDINLFRKNKPLRVAELAGQEISLAPNGKKIFLSASSALFDLKEETLSPALLGGQTASSTAIWSPDSGKIIIGKNLFNLKNPAKNINLEKSIGAGIFNLRWNGESDKVYYQYKDTINCLDLENQKNETLVKGSKIVDYTIKGKELYYIEENNLTARLKFYSLNDKKIDKEMGLPFSDGYRLINQESKLLNLFDEKYKTLYLIDPAVNATSPLIKTIDSIERTEWASDKELIWTNNFEIWVLNLEKGEKRLITRWSEPIKSIIKTGAENYILYTTEKAINVITWTVSNEIRVTELAAMDKIFAPVFDSGEKNLYFLASDKEKNGLYKLNIQ